MMIPNNTYQKPYDSVDVDVGEITVKVLLDYAVSRGIYTATYTLHEHPVHEIYYIDNGWIIFECGGKIHELHSGDIFTIKAHMSHRVQKCSNDLSRFHIRFQFVNDSLNSGNVFSSAHIGPTSGYCGEIRDLIRKIRSFDIDAITKYSLCRLRAYLGILFSYIFEYIESNPDRNSDDCKNSIGQYNRLIMFAMIDDFFADRYSQSPSIDELAQILKYSRIQTQRIIHEYYGLTFSQKLRETRIRFAKQFLSGTNMTIDEIAEKCGYKTRQGFESAFVKVTSMTPNKFRHSDSE